MTVDEAVAYVQARSRVWIARLDAREVPPASLPDALIRELVTALPTLTKAELEPVVALVRSWRMGELAEEASKGRRSAAGSQRGAAIRRQRAKEEISADDKLIVKLAVRVLRSAPDLSRRRVAALITEPYAQQPTDVDRDEDAIRKRVAKHWALITRLAGVAASTPQPPTPPTR